LLIPTRAKIETFIEWAWDYFGRMHVDPILDRPEEVAVDWTDAEGKNVPQTQGQTPLLSVDNTLPLTKSSI